MATALAGDLWADTANNQLYIFTGSGWTLVGPEYSDGLLTGAKPVVITGKDEVNYTVLQTEVQGNVVAIYSTKLFESGTIIGSSLDPIKFTPTANIGGAGVGKFYGTSEKAESLVVFADELPMLAQLEVTMSLLMNN